ncbi:unnamed protein product, partial [Brugia timori]|uniref:BPTI/Kunitz inhibitor domain-containing protein n=1 Tax=Brugia timori TaxID=42155 RepID=A0A0R3R6F2_9BILA
CNQACRYQSSDDPSRRCILPHDPGNCDGNFERWHFDMRIRQCVCSWWSGCGGNANMFYSYTHCMSICGIYADNRTSETKMSFRRFIPESKSNQIYRLNETMPTRQGRQYSNLFKMQAMNARNDQSGGAQLARRYQYLLRYNPSQRWRMISNRFKQEPRQRYHSQIMIRKRGRMQIPQERLEKVRINVTGGQISYSGSREVPRNSQIMSQNNQIRMNQTTESSEHLRAKQMQIYERARAEALRERNRLIEQRRRDEYERAMLYQQELQRYQQALQSAQNRIPKERIDDKEIWRQQQQVAAQGQYLNSRNDQSFGESSSRNFKTSEEMKHAKLKHRKLLNFEKLKQLEKDRKLLKATSKMHQHWWWAQQQQQQQQQQRENWSDQMKVPERDNGNELDSEYGKQPTYTAQPQRQQQTPSYQTSSDSYQVQGQVRDLLEIPTNPTNTELEMDQSVIDQSVREGNWHRSEVQPDAERFPFEMIVAADRVPDRQDAHFAETISASPSSSSTDDVQKKQLVTIEDYEDENYAYDQQTENENGKFTFTFTFR